MLFERRNLRCAPNFARHASLCLSSRNVGYFATMGGVPDSDLANSRYILMFGANRAEAFEPPYNQDMVEGIKKGASARLDGIGPH